MFKTSLLSFTHYLSCKIKDRESQNVHEVALSSNRLLRIDKMISSRDVSWGGKSLQHRFAGEIIKDTGLGVSNSGELAIPRNKVIKQLWVEHNHGVQSTSIF